MSCWILARRAMRWAMMRSRTLISASLMPLLTWVHPLIPCSPLKHLVCRVVAWLNLIHSSSVTEPKALLIPTGGTSARASNRALQALPGRPPACPPQVLPRSIRGSATQTFARSGIFMSPLLTIFQLDKPSVPTWPLTCGQSRRTQYSA
jgi:hypothetical protein